MKEVPAVRRKEGPDGLVREMARVNVRDAEAMVLGRKEKAIEKERDKIEMERVWRQSMNNR